MILRRTQTKGEAHLEQSEDVGSLSGISGIGGAFFGREMMPSNSGSGPSHSSSWTEDSFEIRVLQEPFSEPELEGTSAPSSIPGGAGDGAGPSHVGSAVIPNESLEASMRNRIVRLEEDFSPYLLDKAKGGYWSLIKHELHNASSQREYNIIIEFENRDLLIRERKHECLRLFNQVLAQHPTLTDLAPYNPQEVFDDFLGDWRGELDKLAEKPVGQRAPWARSARRGKGPS